MTARYNRFNDPTPFTPLSQLSPEAREWHLKVAAAKARERRGEPGAVQELIELGVYPSDVEEVRARRTAEREAQRASNRNVDKEISVEPDKATIDEINKRIALGQQYSRISKDLGLDWWTVRKHAKDSWRGTKLSITFQLNKMASERDPKKRKEMADNIKERVNYLYKGGQALGKTIESIEKTING